MTRVSVIAPQAVVVIDLVFGNAVHWSKKGDLDRGHIQRNSVAQRDGFPLSESLLSLWAATDLDLTASAG